MPAKLRIVLPGLFDLPLGDLEPGLIENELPHLNRLLRLATPRPSQAYSIDEILQDALGLPGPAGLPLAQAFAQAGGQEPSHLMLCQAIHLQAGLQNAVVVPIPGHEKNLEEISIIINDLNNEFTVDCYINEIGHGLFLLHLKALEAPTHYPHILSVLGKIVNPYIEQSRQVLPWYQLLNEIQMFMHQHEVNADRVRRGMLPINSLWCWGAGVRPPALAAKPDWYCDDPVLNQFARSLELNSKSCSRVDEIDNATDAVVIDLRLVELLKTGVAEDLDQILLEIDRNLVKPLLRAGEKHRCSLILMAGYELDFEMRPGARLKFWRPQRTIFHWSGDPQNP